MNEEDEDGIGEDDAALVLMAGEGIQLILPKREDDDVVPPHCMMVAALASMVTHEPDLMEEAMRRFCARLDANKNKQ